MLGRARYFAVAAAGGTAFVDMYATQPLLPALRVDFHTSEAHVAATISSLTFAVALAAPFVGPLADAIGRKRVIVTAIFVLALVTFAASHAHTIGELIFWRFLQGLAMPGIFATTLAYIAEEFPVEVAGRAVGSYIGGNVFGGFAGRYVSALVAAHSGWQDAFLALGALNIVGGLIVLALLPPAQRFTRRASTRGAIGAIGGFLRTRTMVATYAVGASILFTLVAAFTFATFYLSGPPFSLSTRALGNVFFVYLAGVIATPLSGRLIDRFGNRFTVLVALGMSAAGILATLLHELGGVIVGLAVMSTGVFVAQAASQGFVGKIASANRSTAAALYLTCYYIGGGLGAILPAWAFERAGWPGTVGMVIVVQGVAATIAYYG
ncbi:MAG: MFS transporter, partial [Candidatus Eremiobacteraeota bacterium]|nr:MFS transporter [Candidatus Eremiobacteraeota bacterium]